MPLTTQDRRTGPAGFTILEVMVAMLVLVVGLLGTLMLLDGALAGTSRNNERVGATNLGRELVETARGLDYDELTPALLVEKLQARGLGASATPWTIERRGVTYTIAASACTYDDGADKIAASAPDDVCSPLPPGATGDDNGDDFRRISFAISWSDRGGTRSQSQTDLVANPSGGLGPRIASVSPPTQTVTANVATATIDYQTAPAAAVHWQADNGQDEAAATGGPTNWRASWNIGFAGGGSEVLDGSYRITAQAIDSLGIQGDSKLATVILNRSRPYAPRSPSGGHDTRLSPNSWVELEWRLNDERDIVGYRAFWSGPDGVAGNADDVQVCPASTAAPPLPETASSCTDLSPADGGTTKYNVVAYDRLSAGGEAPGTRATVAIAAPGSRPEPPTGPLEATTSANDTPTLTWGAPATGAVSFYRIYRGGTAIGDRHARTGDDSRTWSDDDGGAGARQYWVTAIDSAYNESDPIGPVSWP